MTENIHKYVSFANKMTWYECHVILLKCSTFVVKDLIRDILDIYLLDKDITKQWFPQKENDICFKLNSICFYFVSHHQSSI